LAFTISSFSNLYTSSELIESYHLTPLRAFFLSPYLDYLVPERINLLAGIWEVDLLTRDVRISGGEVFSPF